MGAVVTVHGELKKTKSFLKNLKEHNYLRDLEKFGTEGVNVLKAATPVDTGITRDSWRYEITQTNNRITLAWYNDNAPHGIPVVILLQYGHATRNGGYVVGRDFINPAIAPLFDKIAEKAWIEVKNS